MKGFFKLLLNWRLELAVFIAGAVVMVFEIVASRLLAPYFGTSLITWTSIIGVILASLSAGYYWGGRLADYRADKRYLALILAAAGFLLFLTLAVQSVFLTALTAVSWSLKTKSVLAAVILLAPVSCALGMASPYAAKLKLVVASEVGGTVGKLYALSTLGSLFGTFGAGFWLVPFLGTVKILALLVIVLWLTAVSLFFDAWPNKKSWLFFGLCLVALIAAYGVFAKTSADLIDVDTAYSRVWIYDGVDKRNDQPLRLLRLDSGFSSAMYLQSRELVFDYTKFYRLASYFNPGLNKALMIGGAAYSYPKDFLLNEPRAELTVVEIDPAVTALARQYFKLPDDPRLLIRHEDGRMFLNQNQEKYDAILVDAFSASYSIPFHLTTLEAVRREYDSLNDDGVVMVNVVAAIGGAKGQITRSLYYTYKKIFPQVYLLPVEADKDANYLQNVMLVALKSKVKPDFLIADPVKQEQLSRVWIGAIEEAPILTDDWAPTDYFTSRSL